MPKETMQIYKHKQIGTLVILTMGIAILLTILGMILVPSKPSLVVSGPLLAKFIVCLITFYALTVEVDNNEIIVWFGPGIFRKTFNIKTISNAKAVKNPWYDGWGIRLLPKGWLYNISGYDAMEIELKNNRIYRIGTDDPNGLSSAIEKALQLNKLHE